MSSPERSKIINLKSSDGHFFEVEEKVANMSLVLKLMLEDLDSSGSGGGNNDDKDNDALTIPLHMVEGRDLAKVIEYCKNHVDDEDDDDKAVREEGKAMWDNEFIKEFDKDFKRIFALLNAANYMQIRCLTDLLFDQSANMIKSMTVEEVRKIFNVKNHDYTPDEEAKLRNLFAWAFENIDKDI